MTLPFPYNAVAGVNNDPVESMIQNLFSQYIWIARLADEINIENQLDMKRVMQITTHARQYARWYNEIFELGKDSDTLTRIYSMVGGFFAFRKCHWNSLDDMKKTLEELRDAGVALADWLDLNVSEYKQGYSTNIVLTEGVMTDVPIKRVKSNAVANQIRNFRALFGPRV